MGAKTDQRNCLLQLVNPDQQEVILDVALHTAGIIPCELMWFMLRFYSPGLLKLSQDHFQIRQFRCIVLVAFHVFLKLCRVDQLPHTTEPLRYVR